MLDALRIVMGHDAKCEVRDGVVVTSLLFERS